MRLGPLHPEHLCLLLGDLLLELLDPCRERLVPHLVFLFPLLAAHLVVLSETVELAQQVLVLG